MSGWISVKDRMPSREGLASDESEYVLVLEHYSDQNVDFKQVSICGYFADGWSDWDSFGGVVPQHITHWMPLPEPPEVDI